MQELLLYHIINQKSRIIFEFFIKLFIYIKTRTRQTRVLIKLFIKCFKSHKSHFSQIYYSATFASAASSGSIVAGNVTAVVGGRMSSAYKLIN